MRLLLLIAAALAQPEKLLERGTSHYNAGDSTKAHRAFVQLSNDMEAPPHLRAQAHQGLAALAQRRGDPVEAAAHAEQATPRTRGVRRRDLRRSVKGDLFRSARSFEEGRGRL